MSLLVDESIPTVQDLLNCDGSLMDVAGAEGIDLPSKLAMARAEIVTRLQIFLMDHGENPRAVETVVVTEPLQRWISLSAISLSFRDGHFRHLSDRYKEKWVLYDRLAEGAREDLMRMGVGRTVDPIRKPSAAALSMATGALAEGSYAVGVTAVSAGGAESDLSDIATVYLSAPAGIRIEAPAGADPALRWNVYAGRTAEDLQKQTIEPLPADGYLVLEGLASHGRPGNGQQATTYTREVRRIRRG